MLLTLHRAPSPLCSGYACGVEKESKMQMCQRPKLTCSAAAAALRYWTQSPLLVCKNLKKGAKAWRQRPFSRLWNMQYLMLGHSRETSWAKQHLRPWEKLKRPEFRKETKRALKLTPTLAILSLPYLSVSVCLPETSFSIGYSLFFLFTNTIPNFNCIALDPRTPPLLLLRTLTPPPISSLNRLYKPTLAFTNRKGKEWRKKERKKESKEKEEALRFWGQFSLQVQAQWIK